MLNKKKLVTIICPCYNHQNFVGDLLDSVIDQTYDNIEFIIIDDCSTDNSYLKILEYKEKLYNRFKSVLIQKNNINCGVVKTINKIIMLSNGYYIKPIASDDFLDKNCIAKLVDEYSIRDDLPFIFSNISVVDYNSKYLNFNVVGKTDINIDKINLFDKIYEGNFIPAPAVILKKGTFDRYGLYNECYPYEDYPKWLQILKNDSTFVSDESLVYYRALKDSLSRGFKLLEKSEAKNLVYFWIELIDKYSRYVSDDKYENIGTLDKVKRAYMAAISAFSIELIKYVNTFIKTNNIQLDFNTKIYLIAYGIKCVCYKIAVM